MLPVQFLADESCDYAVVRALRSEGYDVSAVAERDSGLDDRAVIDQASQEARVLITEDTDFGWLVFANQVESAGVILVRFPGNARADLAATVVRLVRERGDELRGAFTVIQPGYTRVSRRLGGEGA